MKRVGYCSGSDSCMKSSSSDMLRLELAVGGFARCSRRLGTC